MTETTPTTDYVKHTTHTDALDTLGDILDEDDTNERDAIHLAVFKVQAAEPMGPGMHVYLDADGRARFSLDDGDAEATYVGIVDPFLKTDIEADDWFWLVVYPRQITSLRHVWEHPSFPESAASRGETRDKTAARERLSDWLSSADVGLRGDTRGVDDFVKLTTGEVSSISLSTDPDDGDDSSLMLNDEYIHSSGWDASGEIPDWVWDDVEALAGKPAISRPKYFSCGC